MGSALAPQGGPSSASGQGSGRSWPSATPAAPVSGVGPHGPANPAPGGTQPTFVPACPDLTGCIKIVDATWDANDTSLQRMGLGRMTMKITNTCDQDLRVALWLPRGADYSPSYFSIPAYGSNTQKALGTRNEWQIQASQANADNACLKYP